MRTGVVERCVTPYMEHIASCFLIAGRNNLKIIIVMQLQAYKEEKKASQASVTNKSAHRLREIMKLLGRHCWVFTLGKVGKTIRPV